MRLNHSTARTWHYLAPLPQSTNHKSSHLQINTYEIVTEHIPCIMAAVGRLEVIIYAFIYFAVFCGFYLYCALYTSPSTSRLPADIRYIVMGFYVSIEWHYLINPVSEYRSNRLRWNRIIFCHGSIFGFILFHLSVCEYNESSNGMC